MFLVFLRMDYNFFFIDARKEPYDIYISIELWVSD